MHFVLALRRAYETTAVGAVWRAALIGVLYLVGLALTMFVLITRTVAAVSAPA